MSTAAAWPAPTTSRPFGIVEFRAMASPCRIVADDVELARAGERLVHELEARWSRFRSTSEVSALNNATGCVTVVSGPTFELLERAERARHLTGGLFEPFVLDRLEALEGHGSGALGHAARPAWERSPIAADSILLLPDASAVCLPVGGRFDPGGIGKGLAGDMVVEQLLAAGATTVQVELGGDVRLAGERWTGGAWDVTIRDPFDRTTPLTSLSIAEGAVATSSPHGRTWRVDDRIVHHLIDPRTGQPAAGGVRFVTATSSELWWAEVVAKAAVIVGLDAAPALMRELGASGVIGTETGDLIPVAASTCVRATGERMVAR
jgi:thiamine biosynthesis lipoprotein